MLPDKWLTLIWSAFLDYRYRFSDLGYLNLAFSTFPGQAVLQKID